MSSDDLPEVTRVLFSYHTEECSSIKLEPTRAGTPVLETEGLNAPCERKHHRNNLEYAGE